MTLNTNGRGRSQTTFTDMGEGGGARQMSTLLDKFGKFYQVKLSTRGEGGQNRPKICERSL